MSSRDQACPVASVICAAACNAQATAEFPMTVGAPLKTKPNMVPRYHAVQECSTDTAMLCSDFELDIFLQLTPDFPKIILDSMPEWLMGTSALVQKKKRPFTYDLQV